MISAIICGRLVFAVFGHKPTPGVIDPPPFVDGRLILTIDRIMMVLVR